MPTSSFHCDFSLHRDAWGRVVLVYSDGRRLENVEIARAFPISAPDEYVSICGADGHEVVCIEDPSSLPAPVLTVVEEELARREFVPIITQIKEVFADTDPSEWRVVTDRGPTTFLMEDSDNDLRRLGPYRMLLLDTHGIRYLIPDTRRLDAGSRRVLERYI